ncbi:MAG: hypothetical protein GX610_16460, partial [Rhodococcus sp.]|nr:hypothetical protein [Rhodococcus sp. (in: high G+C Gram-positive bacteria)]
QFFAVADPDYAGPLSIAAGPDLSTDEAAAFWEWFREQKRDHEYGDGSYYSMNGFTATYPNGPAGTTLDLSLESDIEFDDVPDDHPVFEQDGVVITVIGIAADPDLDFDDGQPSTARIVGAQAGGLLACSLASSVGGGLACGAVTNLVSGIITQSGDAQATIPCVVVATPIDEDGTVVGQPVLTTADIGVTLSPQEQLEQMDGALEEIAEGDAEVVVVDGEQVLVTPLDAASAQVLPAYGNTFVVMDDVENSSPT